MSSKEHDTELTRLLARAIIRLMDRPRNSPVLSPNRPETAPTGLAIHTEQSVTVTTG